MTALVVIIGCILWYGYHEFDKPKEQRDPHLMFLFIGVLGLFAFIYLVIKIKTWA